MAGALREATLSDMTTDDGIELLELQEFRLRAADSDGAAARIVAASSSASGSNVPLLTSIDDPCDVATLRAVRAGGSAKLDRDERAALASLVSTWEPLKRYQPRITERSNDPPSYFRLAVTESGINDEMRDAPSTLHAGGPAEGATGSPVGLLWIGAPVGTHAGLLVLIGHKDEGQFAEGRDRSGWPLLLSLDLGVRVYESSRE